MEFNNNNNDNNILELNSTSPSRPSVLDLLPADSTESFGASASPAPAVESITNLAGLINLAIMTSTQAPFPIHDISTSKSHIANMSDLGAICSDYCKAMAPCLSQPVDPLTPEELLEGLSTWKVTLILIPVVVISLTIILGNLLVIIAVFTQKSLRSPQNIYIVSLSIADMSVAIIVLPLSITTLLEQGIWIFGGVLCPLYLIADVSLCTASILHLCAIAIDRYRAITDGINYMHRRSTKSVLQAIIGIWIISFWIGCEPVLDLDWDPKTRLCELPTDFAHSIHLAVGALFFPLAVMGFLYYKIYMAIKDRLREKSKVNCIELASDYETSDKIDPTSTSAANNVNGSSTATGTLTKSMSRRKVSKQISAFIVSKQKFSLTRERKAAKTLGLIMGAFIICWLPLGFLNIIASMSPAEYQPNATIFQLLTWLGYVNSALNPIIYAASNHEFQKGFKKVLRLG